MTNLLIAAKQDLIAGEELAKTSIDWLESELQNKAVKLCSHARWLEEGEKPTKYFLKLESSPAQKIPSLLFIILLVLKSRLKKK